MIKVIIDEISSVDMHTALRMCMDEIRCNRYEVEKHNGKSYNTVHFWDITYITLRVDDYTPEIYIERELFYLKNTYDKGFTAGKVKVQEEFKKLMGGL